jgi:hypothetical protein
VDRHPHWHGLGSAKRIRTSCGPGQSNDEKIPYGAAGTSAHVNNQRSGEFDD